MKYTDKEEQIQKEIRKKIFALDSSRQKKEEQIESTETTLDVMETMTKVSRDDMEQIANKVRSKHNTQETANEVNLFKERSRIFVTKYFFITSVISIIISLLVALISESSIEYSLGIFIGLEVASGIFLLYSLPGFIAFGKEHQYRWIILLANWLLGATAIVWLILLVFSLGLFGTGAFAQGDFAERTKIDK